MKSRIIHVIATAALALACMVSAVACQTSAPTPTATDSAIVSAPDASITGNVDPAFDAGHKLGLPVNNVTEIGNTLAEIGLVQWAKTAADLSTTQDAGTAETAIGLIGPGPSNIEVASVQFNPTGALTASDTQNAVIKVFKRNAPDGGGGTTQTLLATASTFTPGKDGGTGSWFPFTPVTFTMASGPYVSPGDAITMSITKNGTTGVSVPSGQLVLYTSIR